MDELDDIKADPLDIEELDKLIETTKLSTSIFHLRTVKERERRHPKKDSGGQRRQTTGSHRRLYSKLPDPQQNEQNFECLPGTFLCNLSKSGMRSYRRAGTLITLGKYPMPTLKIKI